MSADAAQVPGSPPSVAMFVPVSQGGHPRYALSVASAVADARAFDIVYVSPTDAEVDETDVPFEVARILPPIRDRGSYRSRLRWAVSRLAFYTRRELALIRWLLRRGDIRILHLQDPIAVWMFPLVYLVARSRGVHLVATVHNLRPHATGDALPRYRERLAWLWARRLDAVFVHEGVGLAMAARKLRVPPERLIEIRHGVFDERCPPPLREDRSLLFFGKWRRNKGLVQLIEALADLADWRLLVAGPADDAAYADLSRSLATPNVEFDERFIPEHEIAEVFARASACVLPYTKMDAQSGVLHLAIGSGRPVVVTPVGGMASVVREFGCGVVAASSAPADLRAAVRRLFDEETFAAATVGVASAREHLGWGAAARATIDGYRRVSGI